MTCGLGEVNNLLFRRAMSLKLKVGGPWNVSESYRNKFFKSSRRDEVENDSTTQGWVPASSSIVPATWITCSTVRHTANNDIAHHTPVKRYRLFESEFVGTVIKELGQVGLGSVTRIRMGGGLLVGSRSGSPAS